MPGKRKDLTAPPRELPPVTKSLVASKPAYKIRQMEREERAKNRYKVPEIVEKITAEKQIVDNPLLHPEDDEDNDHDKTHTLTSLSLHDLCRMRIAFEKADEDGSGALDQQEFVDAFLPVLDADPGDVHLLFMRIDADSDGTVTWEEFLSYVLSQDEGKLQIAAESSRQLFDYPGFSDSALQIHGHKDSAGGLLHLEDADKYISFSRKGEMMLWRPDCLDSVSKIIHPREFQTNLPFITQLVHIKRFSHSDRVAISSADTQIIFVDLLRETTKLTGRIKVDVSPLCMCAIVVKDEVGEVVDEMICLGDDNGHIHLYDTAKLNENASRNMMTSNPNSTEVLGCKDAHKKTWKAHESQAWISKVEYYDDSRMIISCASDGQLVISDAVKGVVKIDGFRHRGDISDFVWMRKNQLLASCGLERHINLWQIPIKTPVYKLEGHQASIQQLVYGMEQLISLDTSKTLFIWDLREMSPIQRLEGMKMHQEFPVGRMIFDHKKQGIVSIARKPLFWHITERKVPSGHIMPVSCAVYNPMFQTLVSADESSVVRVWNLNTGQAITRFTDAHVNVKGEPVKITSTMFDSSYRRLVTGAHDGSIKLWNFSTGAQLKEFIGFGDSEVTGMACMHMTPYDYMLASGWNRKVTFWLDPHSLPADKAVTMTTQKPQLHMHGSKEDILCMACYPEMHLLVTGAYDGDIIIWNLETGHVKAHLVLPGIASLKTDQKPIEAMQLAGIRTNFLHKFPPKNKKPDNIVVLLFTASGDGVIRVWSTGAVLRKSQSLPRFPYSSLPSPLKNSLEL